MRYFRAILLATAVGGSLPGAVDAQSRPTLQIVRESGAARTVSVELDRGYAVVPAATFELLGWSVNEAGSGVELSAAGEISVTMRLASPFFRWDGVVLQFTDPPYRATNGVRVPLQFLTDFLPRRLPGLYDYEGATSTLRAGDLALLGDELEALAARDAERAASVASLVGDLEAGATAGRPEAESGTSASDPVAPAPSVGDSPDAGFSTVPGPDEAQGPSVYDGVRVVVIDAGHGGADPGALGPGDIREKAVVLGIALRLEAALADVPNLEVHMIRDSDVFVDIWDRGQIATEAKGERPGIFVSVHANSFPARREARGFETFFLSDARTEHERRVSAIENAPISMGPQDGDSEELEDMDFILRDLRNYDHAHWSQNLAGIVQEELGTFHPGPNRGVKQGVLAVLTNALMPSVLIEVGYLSNRDEASLIAEADFQQDSAEAIAEAVVRFFERYPPGSGTGSGGPRE